MAISTRCTDLTLAAPKDVGRGVDGRESAGAEGRGRGQLLSGGEQQCRERGYAAVLHPCNLKFLQASKKWEGKEGRREPTQRRLDDDDRRDQIRGSGSGGGRAEDSR